MIKYYSNLVTILADLGLVGWEGGGGGKVSLRGKRQIIKGKVEREIGAPDKVVLPYQFQLTL